MRISVAGRERRSGERQSRRSSVMPDEIMDRDLLEVDIPDLSAALVRLRTAYDRGGRTIAPELESAPVIAPLPNIVRQRTSQA